MAHQTTQSCIQISERLKALALQPLAMKQQFFTHHSELHLLVELVQKVLKKRTHSLEQLPKMESALQPPMSCAVFTELARPLALVHQTTQSSTQTSEPLKALVRQQQMTKQQFFILHLGQHLQADWVQRTRKRRAHSLELFQIMEVVLQSRKNCAQFTETPQQQDSLVRLFQLGMEY
jgi:superfamily II DNA helicase RecQ